MTTTPSTAARNRATSEPGGCECNDCGAIFIGGPEHTVCGLCVDTNTAAPAQTLAVELLDYVQELRAGNWNVRAPQELADTVAHALDAIALRIGEVTAAKVTA